MKDKIIQIVGIIGFVIGLWVLFYGPLHIHSNGPTKFGAVTTAGGLLAENYVPYVLYNGGYNSAKDINTSAFLGSTGTFSIGGANGTSVSRIDTGTCYILAYSATIAASTTAQVDCQATAAIGGLTTASATALSGVAFGDFVQATLSTTTSALPSGAGNMGLFINGVSASTTAGYITIRLTNLGSSTFTWPQTGTATGTASYLIVR